MLTSDITFSILKIRFSCLINICFKKSKGSQYSITERRFPELILVLGNWPEGDVSHKPGYLYFQPGL